MTEPFLCSNICPHEAASRRAADALNQRATFASDNRTGAPKQRWRVEQGHQQRKEEQGLDHFEGRNWRGFYDHAAPVLPAEGFLLLEQAGPRPRPNGSRKEGAPSNRRPCLASAALQRLLLPLAKPDRPCCHDQRTPLLAE